VNMPVLEACAVIGVIAEVVVTVVVIAREVTVRAADEVSAKAAVPIVIAAKAAVSIVVTAKVVVSVVVAAKAGGVRFGTAEAAQMRTSEHSHGAAAGMFATKSAAHAPTAESTAQAAAPESAAAFMAAASESSMTAAATTSATESPTASVTATTTATADRPRGHGVRPHCGSECNGDEEDHDLACDRLLLHVGRYQNVFHCCHSKGPACSTEIMFTTNRFNRTSVALPVERNSGMDCGNLADLTAVAVADQPSSRGRAIGARRPTLWLGLGGMLPMERRLGRSDHKLSIRELPSSGNEADQRFSFLTFLNRLQEHVFSRWLEMALRYSPQAPAITPVCRRIADAREPPGAPLGGSRLDPAI
jgi:hypothetical protein